MLVRYLWGHSGRSITGTGFFGCSNGDCDRLHGGQLDCQLVFAVAVDGHGVGRTAVVPTIGRRHGVGYRGPSGRCCPAVLALPAAGKTLEKP